MTVRTFVLMTVMVMLYFIPTVEAATSGAVLSVNRDGPYLPIGERAYLESVVDQVVDEPFVGQFLVMCSCE